ncbi:hypothetical protein [uncultured Gordonia sp.]|uniref:hypothetical protein n=1 Tax=uncultured Gordonia sp. TaxID=198437 RepID=UPI00259AA79B|nr:hypothetical protein [uncultured Gordonia sp.]
MLTLALAATLLGFVLLILGLITGTVWLAVACIVVCLVGLGFLLADVFAGRKGEAARSLEDMVPGAGRDTDPSHDADDDAVTGHDSDGDRGADAPTRRYPAADTPGVGDSESAGYWPGAFDPGMAAPAGSVPPNRPAPERREGNLEDYLRSVGGDSPSGDGPPRGAPPTGVDVAGGRAGPPPGSRPPGVGPQSRQPGVGQQSCTQQQARPQQGQFGPPQSGPPPTRGQRPPVGPPSAPRPFDPQSSGWAPDDVPGGDVAGPDDWATSPDESAPRRRRADFDPLDPNWHPPPD